MMGQKPKPMEEILGYLKEKKRVVLIGCGGCSTVFHTGGEKEVDEMVEKLSREGKEVVAKVKMPLNVFTCYLPMSSRYIERHLEDIRKSDAILMMCCGDGLQVVRQYLESKYDIFKPIYPAVDSLGFFGGGPTMFTEECQGCGECILAYTAGICPLTRCPKNLLNGPCGGVRPNGKCEVDPEADCVWIRIYERHSKLDVADLLEILGAKDWSKMRRPRRLEVEPLKVKM